MYHHWRNSKSAGIVCFIRAIVDQRREPARFILLGSASPCLLRKSSESLAGRISYTELMPFDLNELPPEINLQTHWFRGGFPDALLAPNDTMCGRWLESLIETFIERDVRLLGYELAPAALVRLITVLTSVHGNILNVSDISRTLGISQPTVKHYLDILEGAFLITRLQPYLQIPLNVWLNRPNYTSVIPEFYIAYLIFIQRMLS